MNIFFTHSPRINIKMRRSHALYYFLMEQFYFSGLAMAVAVLLLLMYYAFGDTCPEFQITQLGV